MIKPFETLIYVVVEVYEGEIVDVLGEFFSPSDSKEFIEAASKKYPAMSKLETKSIWRTYEFD